MMKNIASFLIILSPTPLRYNGIFVTPINICATESLKCWIKCD